MAVRDLITDQFVHSRSIVMNTATSYLANTTDQDLGIGNAWTIAFWVKPKYATAANTTLVHIKNSGATANSITISRSAFVGTLNMTFLGSGGATIKNYVWGTGSRGPVNQGDWAHIAFTWDGTTLIGYINGQALTADTKTTDNAGTMTNTNRSIAVGATIAAATPSASIWHSLGIWSAALTATDVYKMWAGETRHNWRGIAPDSLKHYWLFGRDGNLAPDYGPTSIDLTANKGAGLTTANISGVVPVRQVQTPLPATGHQTCVSFDGSTQNMQMSDQPAAFLGIANAWTVMIWMKPTENSFGSARTWFVLGASNNKIQLIHQGNVANDPLQLQMSNSAGSVFKVYTWDNLINANQAWQQIIVTWDGTNVLLYSNGVLTAESARGTDNAGTMTDAARSNTLAASNVGTSVGKMRVHSLACWPGTASQSDVTAIFNGGNGYTCDLNFINLSIGRPTHWWLFGDSKLTDQFNYDRVNFGNPNNFASNYPLNGWNDNPTAITAANCVADFPSA